MQKHCKKKKSSRLNKGRNIIFLLLITTIPSLQETNYCKESSGKCVKCVKDASDNKILRCSKCWNSVITKEGKCEGSSTGITNCLATGQTVYGLSFDPPGKEEEFTPVCAQCKPGHHPDMFEPLCYDKATITNCELEFRATLIGFTSSGCFGCKNGYKPVDKKATAEDPETSTCEKTPEIPGCLLSGESGCVGCDKDKKIVPSGESGDDIACGTVSGVNGEACFAIVAINWNCHTFGCNGEKGYFTEGLDKSGDYDICKKVLGGGNGAFGERVYVGVISGILMIFLIRFV